MKDAINKSMNEKELRAVQRIKTNLQYFYSYKEDKEAKEMPKLYIHRQNIFLTEIFRTPILW